MADHYMADAEFLRALIVGETDTLAPDSLGRLTILWGRYSRFDPGMADLCQRAFEAHHAAMERAEEAADRELLNGLIDGTGDLLSEDTFPRMEPMFAKYEEGTPMYALLEKAATVFGNAVQEVAYRAMATWVIDDARRRAAEE